jgi:hypothetical protein
MNSSFFLSQKGPLQVHQFDKNKKNPRPFSGPPDCSKNKSLVVKKSLCVYMCLNVCVDEWIKKIIFWKKILGKK